MKSSWKNKNLSLHQFAQLYSSTNDSRILKNYKMDFSGWLSSMKLPDELISTLKDLYIPLINLLMKYQYLQPGRIPVIGISGSQGSGKSTFTTLLTKMLETAYGYKVASFSIDDFYCTRSEREELSRKIHPLLKTRGVPGTHNVDLALNVLESLLNAGDVSETKIPVFDKSIDDQKPMEEWTSYKGRPDIILFEGWCVGAIPEPDEKLLNPINDLEKVQDKQRLFRSYVNNKLSGDYNKWFSIVDFLIMLKVPSFELVYEWRKLQEKKLAEKVYSEKDNLDSLRIMSDEEIRFFISHYERITKHMLEELPDRANLVLEIGKDHQFKSIRLN